MTTPRTPEAALIEAHMAISDAADFLAYCSDGPIETTNPETATWADVARFSQIVDAVKALRESLPDQYREFVENERGPR